MVIPAFNESHHLYPILRCIRSLPDVSALVVDDGSTDHTARVARSQYAECIRHTRNHGYGGAVATGLSYALEQGYQYCVTIDADGQHDPGLIPRFVGALRDNDAVCGTRYHPNAVYQTGIPKDTRIIHDEVRHFFCRLTESDSSDPFCGFRAYCASLIKRAMPTEPGYGAGLQILCQAMKLDARIAEVPIDVVYRQEDIRKHLKFSAVHRGTRNVVKYFNELVANELL